jgi:hypothetical protein
MRALDRRERLAVAGWLALAIAVWNGLYDLLISRGIKEFLMRAAMHEAGRGPEPSLTVIMDTTVAGAVWVSTLWASIVLLAGLWTVRAFAARRRPEAVGR